MSRRVGPRRHLCLAGATFTACGLRAVNVYVHLAKHVTCKRCLRARGAARAARGGRGRVLTEMEKANANSPTSVMPVTDLGDGVLLKGGMYCDSCDEHVQPAMNADTEFECMRCGAPLL